MPNEHISGREFGALEQQVKNLDDRMETFEKRMQRVEEKVDQLLELANKSKGAWRVTALYATAGATLVSLALTYLVR